MATRRASVSTQVAKGRLGEMWSHSRMTGPSLMLHSLTTQDMEKDEVLNAFFASIFTSKINL